MSGNRLPNDARHHVVIGDAHLTGRVCGALHPSGGVRHLQRPRDHDLRAAPTGRSTGPAVLLHDDVSALRHAPAVARLAPDLPMVVTVFERTVAETRSLLPMGVVRDITSLTACYVVARLRTEHVGEVVTPHGEVRCRATDGTWRRSPSSLRERRHSASPSVGRGDGQRTTPRARTI